MNRFIFLFLLCCFLSGCAKDLLLKKPSLVVPNTHGKDADEVVLMHKTRLEIQPQTGTYLVDVHAHILLRTVEACKRFQRVVVPYPNSAELKAFQARLVRPDGSVFRASRSFTFPSGNFASRRFYDNDRQTALFLERVIPGSVVDFRAVIRLKLSAGGFEAPLQRLEVPVRAASLEVSFPPSFPLKHQVVSGFGVPSSRVVFQARRAGKGARRVLRWSAQRLPGAPKESKMPHKQQSLLRVRIAFGQYTYGAFMGQGLSWEALGRFFFQMMKERITPTPDVRSLAMSLTKKVSSRVEKIRALYDFTRRRINYLFVGIDLGGLIPQPLDHTLRFRYGDCKAKAALFIAMLRSIGEKAHPVLVRTRELGPLDPDFPVSSFNHMIVYLPTFRGGVYMDPTTLENRMELLRWDDQGASALVIDGKSRRLVTLPLAQASKNHRQRELWLERRPDGSISGKLQIRQSGLWRSRLDGRVERGELMTLAQRRAWLEQRRPSLLRRLTSKRSWTSASAVTSKKQEGLLVGGRFRQGPLKRTVWFPLRALLPGQAHSFLQPRKHYAFQVTSRFRVSNVFHFRGWKVAASPTSRLRFRDDFLALDVFCKKKDGALTCSSSFTVKEVSIPLESLRRFQRWMATQHGALQQMIGLQGTALAPSSRPASHPSP